MKEKPDSPSPLPDGQPEPNPQSPRSENDDYMSSILIEAVKPEKGDEEYVEDVVDIDTFLENPEYLGGFFEGEGLGKRENYWRQLLQEIFRFPVGSGYWLVALKGAVGTGKTTTCSAGMAYDLYRLLCCRDPQRTLGVLPSDKIEFAIFNITLTLATDVVWDKITQMISSSPWFSRVADISRKKKHTETLFPKRINLYSGSRRSHSLGRHVYEVIIDEVNFEIITGQVRESFYSLLRRMQSRFMKKGGGLPGRIWVASSETEKSSVLNQLIEEYRRQSGVMVRQPALWDVKPERYNRGWFQVYKGSESRPPDIIDEANEKLYGAELENIIEVPEEHRSDFEASLHDALRDLAGVSTGSRGKLFRQRDALNKALCLDLVFPESFELDFEDKTDQIGNKVLLPGYISKIFRPDLPRFVHIDVALTGSLGLACCYIAEFSVPKGGTTDQKVQLPMVIVEFAFGIKAKAGQHIPLFKVCNFILWLMERGYHFNSITTDGYESEMLRQFIQNQWIETDVLSVDRDSDPYRRFRSWVYSELVYLPDSKLLRKELEELELSPDGKKVDHPLKQPDGTPGSKDVADACCGALWNAVSRADKIRPFYYFDPPPYDSADRNDISELINKFWPGEGWRNARFRW